MALFVAVRDFLMRKDYNNDNINKTKQEIQENKNARIKGYLSLCLLGLGSVFWGCATKVLAQMLRNKSDQAHIFILYFACALLMMVIGVTSATFLSSSPVSMFFSGLEAWQAAIFMLVVFHLDTMEYYPKLWNDYICMIMASVIFSIYWAFNV